ncbi:MAG TPA: allantoicase [Jatrophihabitans sp.]|uniref:allantoicase n=1 Tax=Jatrophihabitans sp. TaxID=1932789 RepID=UPI002EE53EE8
MSGHPAEFRTLADLASRALGGAVVWTNDDFFASAHNLINPGPAGHDPAAFDARGKVYDGWETRRRRDDPAGDEPPGGDLAPDDTPNDVAPHDEVIVRLAAPGLVRGVLIDTSHFTGNFPPYASVEATTMLGYPSAEQLRAATWTPLLAKSELAGDTENSFAIFAADQLSSHLRLRIYPDGGVARFRVHGEPLGDPRFLGGRVDLAATLNGGRILGCSNRFYSAPSNVLAPGRSSVMSDGWENARRRDDGNDWIEVELAGVGVLHHVVIDTSRFVGNAPGAAMLSDADTGEQLLPRTRLSPDTEHRFKIGSSTPVRRVRLDVYPDGGIARLRVFAELTAEARAELGRRWLALLPDEAGVGADELFD